MITRRDLSAAQRAVQAIHAAIEAAKAFPDRLDPDPNLVLCEVADEAELCRAGRRLEAAGVPLRAFHEPDLNMQLTAIATAPVRGPLRRHFQRYPLFKGGSS